MLSWKLRDRCHTDTKIRIQGKNEVIFNPEAIRIFPEVFSERGMRVANFIVLLSRLYMRVKFFTQQYPDVGECAEQSAAVAYFGGVGGAHGGRGPIMSNTRLVINLILRMYFVM